MLSNSNSEFLPPVQDNEFLPPISRWTTLSGLLLVGALGVALAGASAIEYKVTVKAQALIRPAGELRVVQAATEGTITRIFVAENQAVKKGDVIATIDDSRLQTQKNQLQGNIGQARRQLVQINAQIRALNRQIGAETDRINRAVAIYERELDRRRRNYRDNRIITAAEVSEAEANLNSAEAA